MSEENLFAGMMQPINASTNLGRKDLFELEKRGPYHRFLNFPVELPKYVIPEGNTTEPIFSTGSPNIWRNRLTEIYVSPEAMADIKDWEMNLETSENTQEKKCNCDIVSLMRDGCKCGGK